MSSTHRGGKRTPADAYPTPAWCTTRLLEAVDPKREWSATKTWLEPCAGEGAIVAAANKFYPPMAMPAWTTVEIRQDAETVLKRHVPASRRYWGDYLTPGVLPSDYQPDIIISNPPFRIAFEVIQRSLHFKNAQIFMLLRLNFLASVERCKFMRTFAPDVFVMPNRPDFKAHGKTDSIEYAWFRWPSGQRRRDRGSLQVLNATALEERRENFAAIRHPQCVSGDHSMDLDPKDGWVCIRPGCGFVGSPP